MTPLQELVPHRAPMLLLDRVEAADETTLRASLAIHAGTEFLEAEGVPAHIGIEYMAQACAAFAGHRALAEDGAPRIGFLLGSRRFLMHRPWVRLGDRLEVSVTMVFQDQGMGSFAARIEVAGDLAAEAELTVYEPSPGEIPS